MPDIPLMAPRATLGVSQQPSGSPDTIAAALYPPGASAAQKAWILSAAQTGLVPKYTAPQCGGVPTVSLSTAISGSVQSGVASVPVVGGLLSKLLGIFSAHHAAAVAQEDTTLCADVPAINAFLGNLDQEVQSGQLTFDQAVSIMEQAYSAWQQNVQPILKMSSDLTSCNAACYYLLAFRACIEIRKLGYAQSAATLDAGANGYAQPPLTGTISGAVAAAVSAVAAPVAQFTGASLPAPALNVNSNGIVIGAGILILLFLLIRRKGER